MIKSEQFIDKILAVVKKADLPKDIFENLEESPASSDPNPLPDMIEEETEDKEQGELEEFLSQLEMEEDEGESEVIDTELAETLEPELQEPVVRPLSEELEPELEYPVQNLSSLLSDSSYISKLEKLAVKLDVSGGGRWSPALLDETLETSPKEEIDWENLLKIDDSEPDPELGNLREYLPEDAPSTEVDLSDLEDPESSSLSELDVDLSELENDSAPEWEEEVNVDELNCLCSELFGKKKF